MPVRKVFNDENDNEMDLFINTKGALYINVRQVRETQEEGHFITLDKEDVSHLINILVDLHKEMQDSE
jgi:hypothetical protein